MFLVKKIQYLCIFLVTSNDLKIIVLPLKPCRSKLLTAEVKNILLITDMLPFHSQREKLWKEDGSKVIFVCNFLLLLRMIVVDLSFPAFVLSSFNSGFLKHWI